MSREVLQFLQPRPGGVYVDATLGAGGHAAQILAMMEGRGLLIGIDQDAAALALAEERLAAHRDRVRFVHANFAQLPAVRAQTGVERVDGVLFDLGISSMQVDTPERGFSYNAPAPLDMRMDRRNPTTAAEIVNRWSEAALREIIAGYGEERWAGRIARAIVEARERAPLRTTDELAAVIAAAVPRSKKRDGMHPARRTFQALRIAVNRELQALEAALEPAAEWLNPGGVLVVISYHSLEDRLVKQTFQRLSRGCVCPQGAICECRGRTLLEVLTKKPVTPMAEEVEQNRRARSAKLRAARRRPEENESV